MAKKDIPEAGNTQELNRLKDELVRMEETKIRIQNELEEEKKISSSLRKELAETKNNLNKATERLIAIEQSTSQDPASAGDFVEIVACPPDGVKPRMLKMDGVPAPHRIDADGCHYFKLRKENAVRLVSSSSGMRYYMVGPVDSIKARIPDGLYTKDVIINRHSKRKSTSGTITWIPVEVEDKK